MNLIERLDYKITQVQDVKYEATSFMKIVFNYLDLIPTISERIDFIFRQTWNIRTELFHNIRYENVILGIALFAIDEYYDGIDVDHNLKSNSVAKYAGYLYGENSKQNLIQIYRVNSVVKDLFGQR